MKHSQKGSAAITVSLVIILLLVCALGAYLYLHRDTSPQEPIVSAPQSDTQDTPTPTEPTTEIPAPAATAPHATPSPITKVYTDKTFGFSTTYSKTLTASTDKQGKVTLSIPGSSITPVTIVRATGSADTSTGKWGKNVLSYSKSGWVTQLQNAQDGSLYTAATVPFAYTTSGLPLFNGGTRHGFGLSVYVVALSHTKFVIVSGPEGLTSPTGYDYSTDSTLQIAKAIALIN